VLLRGERKSVTITSYEALAIADYRSPGNAAEIGPYKMYAAQNVDINTQDGIRPC